MNTKQELERVRIALLSKPGTVISQKLVEAKTLLEELDYHDSYVRENFNTMSLIEARDIKNRTKKLGSLYAAIIKMLVS